MTSCFMVYDDGDYHLFDDLSEAIKYAEESICIHRREARDYGEWPNEVEDIRIIQATTLYRTVARTDDVAGTEYELVEVKK